MFSIQISDVENTIETYIHDIELYWLEQNKHIKLYSYDFKRITTESNEIIYAFTFSTFTNGNFEIMINWKSPLTTVFCKLKCIQVLKENNEHHELYKVITNDKKSIYIRNIPYESIFGVDDEIIKKRNEIESRKLEWIHDPREFISNKHFLQKQHRYSEKLFWNIYWFQLHMLTIHYPENPCVEDKKEITDLVHAMQHGGIPCNICKQHFILWKQLYPIELYLDSRDKLIKYFINLHNDVNKRNGKTLFSRKDFSERFESKPGYQLVKRQIDLFGLDIVDMFHKRELKSFPESYINTGTHKIRQYVLTIPNFKSMVV